jgi:hypothetical protein
MLRDDWAVVSQLAVGHDGSNLTTTVMAMVRAAAMQSQSQNRKEYDGSQFKSEGARNGEPVSLPQDLDAIRITTQQGTIHIDLAGQVQNMVLMRASPDVRSTDVIRLILSPMDSGRLAVGVIRTPS